MCASEDELIGAGRLIGCRYFSISFWVLNESHSPLSTHSIRPGHGTETTLTLVPANSRTNLRYRSLVMVRVVAMTPTTPVCVAAAAGLIAGSMPMIGMSSVSRIVLTPSAVAVLQETTMALAPLEIKNARSQDTVP